MKYYVTIEDKTLEIELNEDERAALGRSADAVRELWAATEKAEAG